MGELDTVLVEMNKGFTRVHERLDEIAKETTERQIFCHGRFAMIEQKLAVKEATNGIRAEAKARRVNTQTWFVRTTMGVVIVGLLVVIWKIFLGHINLIIQ